MKLCYSCNGKGKYMTPKIKWNPGPHICSICDGNGQISDEKYSRYLLIKKTHQKYRQIHDRR